MKEEREDYEHRGDATMLRRQCMRICEKYFLKNEN